MARLPKIRRRGDRHQAAVDRPGTVTGNFELHYEEIIRSNRFAIVAFLTTGLVAIAAFIPAAVYQSVAGTDTVTVETEEAILSNGAQLQPDSSAAGGKYILLEKPAQ